MSSVVDWRSGKESRRNNGRRNKWGRNVEKKRDRSICYIN